MRYKLDGYVTCNWCGHKVLSAIASYIAGVNYHKECLNEKRLSNKKLDQEIKL